MKRLWFYRGVTAVLLVLLAMLAFKLKRLAWEIGDFGRAHDTWVVSLPERVALITEAHGGDADFSETYLSTSEGSVHLHALGHHQLTPLHLHPASDEATVIIAGDAQVRSVVRLADAGVIVNSSTRGPAGTLVLSPRNAAHEWQNESEHELLFNLVFTSPKFSGNFYLRDDDARIGSAQPVALPQFSCGGRPNRPEPLPFFGISKPNLWALLVTQAWAAPVTSGTPLMLYVVSGQGELAGHRLEAGSLAHLESLKTAELKASQALCVLLFDVTGEVVHEP